MNISIVIPNYNGEAILPKNLPRVIEAAKAYTKGWVEIIITDDASKDGSIAFLEQFISDHTTKKVSLQLVKSPYTTNSGFSGNVNRGAKIAKGDILVLLNTDVNPHKNFLTPLIEYFTDEKVFGVGCVDESIEEGKTVLRGRGVGHWERGFLMHSKGELGKKETLWISCGSGAFRNNIWKKLGGLNELYNPFYWEDIDLSYRARKCGYSTYIEEKSIVIHEHNKGAIKTNYSPYRVQKIVYRNQFQFTWLNMTDTNLVVKHILWLPYHMVKALLRMDRGFFYGFFTALIRIPKILAYKNDMKRHFILSDKAVVTPVQI